MIKQLRYNPQITFTQQCYESIKNDIINGALKPDEKLKVQILKDHLGVGTAPIREALSQLVSTGLVSFEDNKGFRVAKMSEADVRDIYATFTLIETSALILAIEQGDSEWEALVVSEFHKLSLIEHKKESVPYSVWSEQNYNFHQALISGCTSQTLLEIQRNLYLKFDRYAHMAYRMNPAHASANHDKEKRNDHKKLMEAALKRDVQTATFLMTHHINGPLNDVIKILKEQNLI